MTAVLQATDILRKDRGMAALDDNAIKYTLPLEPYYPHANLPLTAVTHPRALTGRRSI